MGAMKITDPEMHDTHVRIAPGGRKQVTGQ
jgi:hypothetical protein